MTAHGLFRGIYQSRSQSLRYPCPAVGKRETLGASIPGVRNRCTGSVKKTIWRSRHFVENPKLRSEFPNGCSQSSRFVVLTTRIVALGTRLTVTQYTNLAHHMRFRGLVVKHLTNLQEAIGSILIWSSDFSGVLCIPFNIKFIINFIKRVSCRLYYY